MSNTTMRRKPLARKVVRPSGNKGMPFDIVEQELPLILRAKDGHTSHKEIIQWIKKNPKQIEKWLLNHGAILFRGFRVDEPQQFEDAALAIDPKLNDEYLGTSPRNRVTRYVHTASELPPHYPIMQHIEMSFLPKPPRKLFFFCLVPPAEHGETPLTDFRKVLKDLNPIIRNDFETKGIRYIRNYSGPNLQKRFNLWKTKRWDEMFETTDRKVVEKTAKENGLRAIWRENEDLTLINERPALRKHPQLKIPVWSNHTQTFHPWAAALEYKNILSRQPTLRSAAISMILKILSRLKLKYVKDELQAMHVTYADGSPIPISHIEHLHDVIWKNMTFTPWEKGDFLAIDNFSVAHGRMPYSGPREILVAWTTA